MIISVVELLQLIHLVSLAVILFYEIGTLLIKNEDYAYSN